MDVFLVFKEGVYRHECGGVFTSLDVAKRQAIKLTIAERDDYHQIHVMPFEIDTPTLFGTTTWDSDMWQEREPVAKFERRVVRFGEYALDTRVVAWDVIADAEGAP